MPGASRRGSCRPLLSHHRTYGSVSGGFRSRAAFLLGACRPQGGPAFPHGFRPLLPAFRPSFETSAKDDQNFGCFAQTDSALHRLVRPATMASADFCQPLPPPLDGGSPYRAGRQTSQGKTCHFPPIYPPHLLPHPPDDYRALSLLALSPGCGCLICGSCSSGREFACGFLQTPPRGDALAVRLTVPVIRVRRGLAPPNIRLPTTGNLSALAHGHAMPGDRVGGGVTSPVLSHHRTYGSVYGGS